MKFNELSTIAKCLKSNDLRRNHLENSIDSLLIETPSMMPKYKIHNNYKRIHGINKP
jgi:hypothetical protein